MPLLSPRILAVLLLLAPKTVSGNPFVPSEISRFENETGDQSDNWGAGVAIDGDTAVVTAPGINPRGEAYVYSRTRVPGQEDTWTQTATLRPGSGNFDSIGSAVDISGNTIVTGSAGTRGRITIYERSPGTTNWTIKNTFDGPSGRTHHVGSSVAIDGEVIAAGFQHISNQDLQGEARVYRRNGAGNWEQEIVLRGSRWRDNDEFGESIDIEGDTIAVGASRLHDPTTSIRGAVFIFQRTNGNWSEAQIISPGNLLFFGRSLCLQGDRLAVGATNARDPINQNTVGALTVYERTPGLPGSWVSAEQIWPRDIPGIREFSDVLAFENDMMIGTGRAAGFNVASALVLLRRQMDIFGNFFWSQVGAPLGISFPNESGTYGTTAAFSQDTLLIGNENWESDTSDDETGAHYFVRLLAHPDAPKFTSSSDPPDPVEGARYTFTVRAENPGGQPGVTLRGENLPAWLSFNQAGDGVSVLTGVPTAAHVGSHQIRILAEGTTTGLQSAQCFTLTVAPRSVPPTVAFSASPTLTTRSGETTLSWNVVGADTITLLPEGLDLTHVQSPLVRRLSHSTTFILQASNASGVTQVPQRVNIPLFSPSKRIDQGGLNIGDSTPLDYDGDGDLDIVTTIVGLHWIRNDDSSFTIPMRLDDNDFSPWSESRFLQGDFDRDGNSDLIYPVQRNVYYFHSRGPGAGFDAPVSIFTETSGTIPALIFDVDNDGNLDVVIDAEDDLVWVKQRRGIFSPPATIKTNLEMSNMAHADFNRDGREDIVFTRWSGGGSNHRVAWLQNLGNGNFSDAIDIAFPIADTRFVASGDLDGDQWPDVLVGRFHRNDLLWWRNDRNGGFEGPQTVTDRTNQPEDMDLGDLDGDGDLDIAVVSSSDREVAWIENLGGGVFGAHQIISTELRIPDWIEIADVNGDGAPDILASGSTDASGVPKATLLFENLNSPPTATNLSIAGTLRVGSTLGTNYVYSDVQGDAEGDTRFRWFRSDDAQGTNRTAIPEANSLSYLAGLDDVDKWLSVEITPIAETGFLTGIPVESPAVGPIVLPEVTITAVGSASVPEDSGTVNLAVAHNAPTNLPLTIALSINGSAELGSDYEISGATPFEVTIPVGSSATTIVVTLVPDNLEEPHDDITVALVAENDYAIAPDQNSSTITILNDDFSPVANADPLFSVVEDGFLTVDANLGVLANDTDMDDGDGPSNLTADLQTGTTNGQLLLRADGSFEYSPNPDYFGPDSFTYRASDGTNASETIRVEIEVTELVDLRFATSKDREVVGAPGGATHTISIENRGPSDATGVVIDLASIFPAGVTRDPLAPTAGTITGTQWTLDLAENEIATLPVTYQVSSTAEGGIDSLTTDATLNSLDQPLTNTDDDSASVSSGIVSPVDIGTLELDVTPNLNLQNGLFTQKVTITNNNPLPLAGFRLLIDGLPADVQAHNSNGATPGGTSFIESNNDLAPGESLTLTIEFFRPSLDPNFDPTFSIEAVFSEDLPEPVAATGGTKLDPPVLLNNGDYLLEFSSVPGMTYAIEYSHDMQTWYRIAPSITANANRTQWIDSGPPKTASHPSSVPTRCYRVITLPN